MHWAVDNQDAMLVLVAIVKASTLSPSRCSACNCVSWTIVNRFVEALSQHIVIRENEALFDNAARVKQLRNEFHGDIKHVEWYLICLAGSRARERSRSCSNYATSFWLVGRGAVGRHQRT